MADPEAWELAIARCKQCRGAMFLTKRNYEVCDRRAWTLMSKSAAAAKVGDVLASHRLNTDAAAAFEEAALAWDRYLKAKAEFAAAVHAARDALPLDAQEELFEAQDGRATPSEDDDQTRH